MFPILEEEFQIHEKSYRYFIHWSSLLYMEILEEIKQQEDLEMIPKRQSVVCEGKVSIQVDGHDGEVDDATAKNKNDPKCTIFIQRGEINCSVGDYLALSPSNACERSVFRERKYIMEVKSCAGKHVYADPVWPNHNDVPDELSRSRAWKITPFPNLVSFNRMLEALKTLCTGTSLERVGIFGELLNTWNETKDSYEGNSENEPRTPGESSAEGRSSKDSQETTVNQPGGLYESIIANVVCLILCASSTSPRAYIGRLQFPEGLRHHLTV